MVRQSKNNGKKSTSIALSIRQKIFLETSTYEFCSSSGEKFSRKLEIVGLNSDSGELLVKETYSGNYPYKKYHVLTHDGETQEYSGQAFSKL